MRMSKATKKNTNPKTETESIEDDAVIANVLVGLQAEFEVLAARRAQLPTGDFDPDLTSGTAAIAKAAMTAVGERRQRAKGRARDLALVPLDELIEHIRSLPERKRDAVIAGVTRSLLSMRDVPLFP